MNSIFRYIGDFGRGESFSGTGDLFASVIAGAKARGDALEEAVDLAGRMIELAMRDAVAGSVPRNEGVEYEKYLWMLTKIPGNDKIRQNL